MEKVKVTKNGVTKSINKSDLDVYLAMGWIEVVDYTKELFAKVK